MKKLLALALCAATASAFILPSAAAEDIDSMRFVGYNAQSGLVSNEVNAIFQSANGLIWCATNNGLSRFDGYDFDNYKSNYRKPDFFSSNTIYDMAEGADGRIWLVGPNGLNCIDQRTLTAFTVKDSLLNGVSLRSVLLLDNGQLLLGGRTGLILYDVATHGASRCDYSVKTGTKELLHVRKLYKDHLGNIWIGAWKRGVYLLMKGSTELICLSDDLISNDVSVVSFLETTQGEMLIGTWGDGLYCLRNFFGGNAEVMKLTYPKSAANQTDWNIIYDIEADDSGHYWLGSPGGLRIVTITNNGITQRHTKIDVGNTEIHEIHSVCKDRDGNMWLSDFGNGIVHASVGMPMVKEVNLCTLGLQKTAVTAVWKGSDDILWLGIRGTGIACYDMKQNRIVTDRYPQLKKIRKVGDSVVSFVSIPDRNELLLSTRYDGVYLLKFNGDAITDVTRIRTNLAYKRNMFTNNATTDADGDIWVSTNAGVVILCPDSVSGTYEKYEPDAINNLLGYKQVEYTLIDRKGYIWLGCAESGLYKLRYDKDSETIVESKSYCAADGGINSDKITTLFEDSSGELWVGTLGGGLSRYMPADDRFEIINNMHLFSSDEIKAIAEDPEGHLWVSTGNGFVFYDFRSDGDNKVRCYGLDDNLKNRSFLNNSLWCSGKDIIFGGYNGLSMFNSFDILSQKEINPPLITDIQIFNVPLEEMDSPEKISALMPPFAERITLGHDQRSFSLTFASPDFENSALTKYAYRMEGLEKEWHYVGSNRRTVTYSNLNPCNYTFTVISSKFGSQWTHPTSLDIKIIPSPWASPWAKIAYGALFALMMFFIFHTLRHKIRLSQALKLEQMERIKSEEVNNAKLIFFTNISHELFTPITIMSCSLDKLMEEYPGEEALHKLIKANLNRLMRLLQQILEFRKAESSNLKLKVSEMDVAAFVKRLCDESFAPLENSKNIKLVFSSNQERINGWADPDKLDKIMYNLISNAYKYNRKDGIVYVHLDAVERNGRNEVVISVKDTGYGIEAQKITSLFKRFYEGDYRKFNTKGTGIGLSLTKDLIDLHKGTINVNSVINEGTTFTVTLCIDKDVYDEDQCDTSVSVTQQAAESAGKNSAETGAKDITLLIVEDNQELLLVMKNILSSRYTVLTVNNGREALELLGKEDMDVQVIISDYLMPEMDGLELCKAVKSDISLSHLPFIMLTAKASVENKLASFNAGVDEYIAKPFDLKLLIAQVDSLLANRRRLAEKFQKRQDIETDSIIDTALDKQFIDKAVRLTEEHLSDPDFNIDAFNQAMNMSNSTLYRKIKGLTGLSPKEFIRNIRFKYACKLLMEKTSNVADVAYMVGFTDAKYFSLSFKREFGMTPSQYISQHKKE